MLPFSLLKQREELLQDGYVVRLLFPEPQTKMGSETSLLLLMSPSIYLFTTLGQSGCTALTSSSASSPLLFHP